MMICEVKQLRCLKEKKEEIFISRIQTNASVHYFNCTRFLYSVFNLLQLFTNIIVSTHRGKRSEG